MIGLLLAAAAAIAVPAEPALSAQIRARDAELFHLYFDACEPSRLHAMVTDDVEFYHDRGGVVARDAAALIADYTKSCTEKLKPDAWHSRRELIASSLKVYPVPGFGAIEDGDHQFYERRGDGPEKLVGAAHFTIIWALTPDGWKMARTLSFGHRAVEAK